MSARDFTVGVFQNEYLPVGAREVNAIVTVTSAGSVVDGPASPPGAAEIIIVDCSGSMGYPRAKLIQARHATAAAIDVIRDGTAFAVVAGAGRAWPLYPKGGGLAIADPRTREDAKRSVARLRLHAGTAIGQWLRLTCELFAAREDTLRHAILLTDGQNEHESADELDAAIELCAGVFSCDCRGVGTDWDVNELRKISTGLLGSVDIVPDPAKRLTLHRRSAELPSEPRSRPFRFFRRPLAEAVARRWRWLGESSRAPVGRVRVHRGVPTAKTVTRCRTCTPRWPRGIICQELESGTARTTLNQPPCVTLTTRLEEPDVRDPAASTIVPQQPGEGVPRAPRRSRRARSRPASGRGVIQHPAFAVEPWAVRETALDLERLAQTESVFALANGHLGLRANLDEGEPFGLPGTYLAGFYETRPLPYAEAGYGDPEDSQTVVNVTNGKIIRLTVEDEAFDVRSGELRKHERVLDLRAGVLHRTAEWGSPTGRLVRVSSTRLVSFTQRSIAAIFYEVEPLDGEAQVVVQSELVTNETLPVTEKDPRAAAALASPLASDLFAAEELAAVLIHTTKASGLTVAAAMDHRVDGPPDTRTTVRSDPELARLTITATVAPGRPLRVTKFVGYDWSGRRTVPALRDQVDAALAGAVQTGWDGLVQQQRAFLDTFWQDADIEIDGDAELQQAVRFALFHTVQAGARGEQRLIPAKGLTGPGYDGHTFWDTEAFVLPLLMLTYSRRPAVADALRWRHSTLDLARERARSLGRRGAAFPWRTIHGEECSGYWPAGGAAFHVNAAIADAVERYLLLTEDERFAREAGVELLVETARLWRSLGHHDGAGHFRIDGVTGPDEYSAIADNNIYTNLMAARNLRAAADAIERRPELARPLGVDDEEAAGWRSAAEAIFIPYDESLGVHPQAEGFTEHEEWDFDSTPPENYPLLLHYPYFDLYRKQVVKQADLVMALFYAGEYFTPEEKARNFAYYERLTVRDSSLSACIQAAVAAEVGHMELAYDYFAEAALLDLDDLQHNTRDGVHIASLAGACTAAIAGFGGLRDSGGTLSFVPRLPQALTRLALNLRARKTTRLRIEVNPTQATYTLLTGERLDIQHYGEPITLTSDQPVQCPIPPANALEPPTQPLGREPLHRRRPAERG